MEMSSQRGHRTALRYRDIQTKKTHFPLSRGFRKGKQGRSLSILGEEDPSRLEVFDLPS